MMVQTSPDQKNFFVLTMAQHTDFCRQLAEAFGNEAFEPLDPRDELINIAANHDCGWQDYDAQPGMDPETRLPYSLTRTPVMAALRTNYMSPEINQRHSAFCGLLSSMHSWGLHNKRYGVSQYVVKSRSTTSITVPPDFEPAKQAMMRKEVERQAELKATLKADPKTASLVEEAKLMRCYKYLQFFDTLSLYFHLDHDAARGTETFIHVPMTATTDASITVTRRSEGVYALAPFPFSSTGIRMKCAGRMMQPMPEDTSAEDMNRVLAATTLSHQEYLFVAG